MNMRKIRTVVQNETKRILVVAQKGKSENWFRMAMRMPQYDENGANELFTLHNHAKLLELVRNIFPSFLVKKPPKDLLDDAKCPLDLSL